MAIGISLMFGIFLPLNFNSPYKATSIIDFWRRWHMTLSQFLRDYLYIPLGGNRHGPVLRYVNLMITMLLGGLWHGAAWTFVVWGALHGAYLCINHAWNRFGPDGRAAAAAGRDVAGAVLTFLAVVVAWVFFRADDIASAIYVLSRMADPTRLAFGRAEIANLRLHRGLCRAGLVRAEHAGDHGLRSRATGPSARSWRRRGCVPGSSTPPRRCWRSGFSESSSTANSSISGSDDSPCPKTCSGFCARARSSC